MTIADNTLLVEEMLHGFGRRRTPKRVRLSVDLRKTFDSLKWVAILKHLEPWISYLISEA